MISAHDVLAQQRPDGSWGQFHTLSVPVKGKPLTTEQALRRLRELGFTAQDEPIQRAIVYMEYHLPKPVPTIFCEKTHDPKIFTDLMLATWLKLFVPEHPGALRVARQWAAVIEAAFADGAYNHTLYLKEFEQQFSKPPNPRAGRLTDFVSFYQIALLPRMLTPKTENAMLDYVISRPQGIYYIYHAPLNQPPPSSPSKTRRYQEAAALLERYASAKSNIQFLPSNYLERTDPRHD